MKRNRFEGEVVRDVRTCEMSDENDRRRYDIEVDEENWGEQTIK